MDKKHSERGWQETEELGDGDTKTSLKPGDHTPGSSCSGKLSAGPVASCREGTTATDGDGFPTYPRGNRGGIARNSHPPLDAKIVEHADGFRETGPDNWRPDHISIPTGHSAL